MAIKPVSHALFITAAALIFFAGSHETANAQANRKIDNTEVSRKPAADLAPTPGSKGSQTEALGAFMVVLPNMLKAIPDDSNPGVVFAMADKKAHSIKSMLIHLFETQPQKKPALLAILRGHGYFQSLDEWALTGDEFTLGMIAAGMKRDNRASYDRIFALTPEEFASMSDQLPSTLKIMREFSDEENAYFDAHLKDYHEVLERHGALIKRAPASQ